MCTPELGVKFVFSSSTALYEVVTTWRNNDPDSWGKRVVAEVSFLPIALFGLIEGVARAVVAVIGILAGIAIAYCGGRDIKVEDLGCISVGGGALLSFETSIRSLIGLVYNIIDGDKLPESGEATRFILANYLNCLN